MMETVEDALDRFGGLGGWFLLVLAIAAAIVLAQIAWHTAPIVGRSAWPHIKRNRIAIAATTVAIIGVTIAGPPTIRALQEMDRRIQREAGARLDCRSDQAGVVKLRVIGLNPEVYGDQSIYRVAGIDDDLRQRELPMCASSDGRWEIERRLKSVKETANREYVRPKRETRLSIERIRLSPELRAAFIESGDCRELFPFMPSTRNRNVALWAGSGVIRTSPLEEEYRRCQADMRVATRRCAPIPLCNQNDVNTYIDCIEEAQRAEPTCREEGRKRWINGYLELE